MTSTAYPATSPHDPIAEVFPGIFLVRGSLQMNALMRIGRNMVVVRSGTDLTVLNSVRLTSEGEAELETLGTVRHVMRLGYFHGRDDRYYINRYGAEFWGPEGTRSEPGPEVSKSLTMATPLPIADAELFLWQTTKHPEAAILIKREGGILITCDGIQHYTDRRHNNWFASLMMPLMGFPMRMLIGPLWKKAMTPEGGTILPDFERLLLLNFEHLIPAHGSVKYGGAKQALRETLAVDFKDSL